MAIRKTGGERSYGAPAFLVLNGKVALLNRGFSELEVRYAELAGA